MSSKGSRIRRRTLLAWGGASGALGAGALLWFWPSERDAAAYPFARRVGGRRETHWSIVSASVEHSCAADYVAVLRPLVSPVSKVRAIERALTLWGRPYDFNFDFATDDQIVCSELVIKAYERAGPEDSGLNIPYVELVGRRALPPTEFVRAFRDELVTERPQFEFVAFLEGREGEKSAVEADAEVLAKTCERPKWDILQP